MIKLVYLFTGEDANLIISLSKSLQRRFFVMGLISIIIFLAAIYSALSFLQQLLHETTPVYSFIIGVLWGLILVNIYIFLLYTITPPILPTVIFQKGKTKRGYIGWIRINPEHLKKDKYYSHLTSLIIRLFVLIIIGLVIAQPLNVELFSGDIQQEVEKYKLDQKQKFLKLLSTNNPTEYMESFEKVIEDSNFYMFRIKKLQRYSFKANLLQNIIIMLFLIPVWLKYRLRSKTEYFEKKKQFEEILVKRNYEEFKILYRQILEGQIKRYNEQIKSRLEGPLVKLESVNFSLAQKIRAEISLELNIPTIHYYEHWADPPFNTRSKKDDIQIMDQDDLLAEIYSSL